MKKLFSCLLVLGAVAVQSCQKETSVDTILQPPTDTTQQTSGADSSFLPRSISVLADDPEDGDVVVSYKYLTGEHQIQVYLDDTTTADPYDRLAITYFYNSAGYFTKREVYGEAAGDVTERFSVERTGDNAPKTIMAWYKDPDDQKIYKDTFAVSIADSASYKIMTVNNRYRSQVNANGDYVELKASTRLLFQNNRLVTERQQRFDERDGSTEGYDRNFTYDASGRLSTEKPEWYYGTAYTYEATGRGLDSFFRVLGGKDGYLLDVEGLWSYDAQAEFSDFPLFIILAGGHTELYAQIHKYGAIKQVKSIPNGTEFPYTEAFDFQNTFDDRQRITQTTITTGGNIYAVWKIKY